MTLKYVMVCDACGKQADAKNLPNVWLLVQSIVSTREQFNRLPGVADGARKLEDVVDFGEFCSLQCVANWASVQANLRSLDAGER